MSHRRYPHLELDHSLAKFFKIAILAEFAGFVKIVASSVPPSRAQSLFGEIHQNRHSHQIRQNRRFVGTPILSSIDLRQNFVKITILAKFTRFVKIASLSVPLSRAQSLFAKFRQNRHSRRNLWIRQNRRFVGTPILSSIDLDRQNFVKIAILAEFAGFVKIAASSVPLSRAQSLFGEISSKSPFSRNSPDSSKSPLCRYPYLELNRSLAKFRQNHHSCRIRRIR